MAMIVLVLLVAFGDQPPVAVFVVLFVPLLLGPRKPTASRNGGSR